MRAGGRAKPSEIVQRLVDIGSARLAEDAGLTLDKAQVIMREVAHEFCKEWGGDRIYLPKDVELPLQRRDRQIWERYTGDNAWALAREYNLTQRQIRYIIGLMRRRAAELSQVELPGLESQ